MIISPLVNVKHCGANGNNVRPHEPGKLEEGMGILWGFYAEPLKAACGSFLLY
jgi:hypothetical protein